MIIVYTNFLLTWRMIKCKDEELHNIIPQQDLMALQKWMQAKRFVHSNTMIQWRVNSQIKLFQYYAIQDYEVVRWCVYMANEYEQKMRKSKYWITYLMEGDNSPTWIFILFHLSDSINTIFWMSLVNKLEPGCVREIHNEWYCHVHSQPVNGKNSIVILFFLPCMITIDENTVSPGWCNQDNC